MPSIGIRTDRRSGGSTAAPSSSYASWRSSSSRVTMVKRSSLSSCEPRWATPRSPQRRTLGPQVAAVAARLGTPLMPWQRLVADVGLELLEDGRPAYREVIVPVPRQSGKTSLILAVEVQRAVGWAPAFGPQRLVYSAQTGADARKKLLEDQ